MKPTQSKTKTRTKAGRTASLRCDALVMHPVARALKNYKETLPYHDACDHTTLGTKAPRRYLANRLEAAFLDGVRSGERVAAERVSESLKRIALALA